MPSPTLTIDKRERDALYEHVRNHLGAINDVWIALERTRDYATAERLAGEFSEDFRLMADLGWDPEEERDWVELTMAPGALAEVARRLREEAAGGLSAAAAERDSTAESEARPIRSYEAARDACRQILAALGASSR